jgi:hypothetical protein
MRVDAHNGMRKIHIRKKRRRKCIWRRGNGKRSENIRKRKDKDRKNKKERVRKKGGEEMRERRT